MEANKINQLSLEKYEDLAKKKGDRVVEQIRQHLVSQNWLISKTLRIFMILL